MADADDTKHNKFTSSSFNDTKSFTGELENDINNDKFSATETKDRKTIGAEECRFLRGTTNNNIGITKWHV